VTAPASYRAGADQPGQPGSGEVVRRRSRLPLGSEVLAWTTRGDDPLGPGPVRDAAPEDLDRDRPGLSRAPSSPRESLHNAGEAGEILRREAGKPPGRSRNSQAAPEFEGRRRRSVPDGEAGRGDWRRSMMGRSAWLGSCSGCRAEEPGSRSGQDSATASAEQPPGILNSAGRSREDLAGEAGKAPRPVPELPGRPDSKAETTLFPTAKLGRGDWPPLHDGVTIRLAGSCSGCRARRPGIAIGPGRSNRERRQPPGNPNSAGEAGEDLAAGGGESPQAGPGTPRPPRIRRPETTLGSRRRSLAGPTGAAP